MLVPWWTAKELWVKDEFGRRNVVVDPDSWPLSDGLLVWCRARDADSVSEVLIDACLDATRELMQRFPAPVNVGCNTTNRSSSGRFSRVSGLKKWKREGCSFVMFDPDDPYWDGDGRLSAPSLYQVRTSGHAERGRSRPLLYWEFGVFVPVSARAVLDELQERLLGALDADVWLCRSEAPFPLLDTSVPEALSMVSGSISDWQNRALLVPDLGYANVGFAEQLAWARSQGLSWVGRAVVDGTRWRLDFDDPDELLAAREELLPVLRSTIGDSTTIFDMWGENGERMDQYWAPTFPPAEPVHVAPSWQVWSPPQGWQGRVDDDLAGDEIALLRAGELTIVHFMGADGSDRWGFLGATPLQLGMAGGEDVPGAAETAHALAGWATAVLGRPVDEKVLASALADDHADEVLDEDTAVATLLRELQIPSPPPEGA